MHVGLILSCSVHLLTDYELCTVPRSQSGKEFIYRNIYTEKWDGVMKTPLNTCGQGNRVESIGDS